MINTMEIQARTCVSRVGKGKRPTTFEQNKNGGGSQQNQFGFLFLNLQKALLYFVIISCFLSNQCKCKTCWIRTSG